MLPPPPSAGRIFTLRLLQDGIRKYGVHPPANSDAPSSSSLQEIADEEKEYRSAAARASPPSACAAIAFSPAWKNQGDGRRVQREQREPAAGAKPAQEQVRRRRWPRLPRWRWRLEKWANGRKLRVGFLDGSATQRARVREHAMKWSAFASITFDFNAPRADAQIRISFPADRVVVGVGTDAWAAYFPIDRPTMNFGWLRDDTDDIEYSRVVIHEFGHALGAIHEHQNPKGGIQWNKQAVYAYFSGPPNFWRRQEDRLQRHRRSIRRYQLIGSHSIPTRSCSITSTDAHQGRQGDEVQHQDVGGGTSDSSASSTRLRGQGAYKRTRITPPVAAGYGRRRTISIARY